MRPKARGLALIGVLRRLAGGEGRSSMDCSASSNFRHQLLQAVLLIRIRIRGIRIFLGLPDPHPHPLVTSTDPGSGYESRSACFWASRIRIRIL